MCGIAGILSFNKSLVEECRIKRMAYIDVSSRSRMQKVILWMANWHLVTGVFPLLICPAQPTNPSSTIPGVTAIIFNGEIYNYADIKPLLAGYAFRTNSDTEVILAGYIQWGADCLKHLRGMYTFAIWDREERSLFIARDRLGVKPLYYFQDSEQFIFASEIRAILSVMPDKKELDHSAIAEYFRYQSVGFPFSPVKGIQQVEAGTWLKISGWCR